MTKHLFFFLCLCMLPLATTWGKECRITVKNPSTYQRQEVVEIPLNELQEKLGGSDPASWVVHDNAGLEIASQTTYDKKFLIPVELIGKTSCTFTVSTGTPSKYLPVTFIKKFTSRKDDMAWENDRIAFRAYGPALQKSGERSYGFDIWVKNTPDWVVNYRYALQTNPKIQERINNLRKTNPQKAAIAEQRISYHIDHGNGLDCYKVGATLGCGAPAILDMQGNIIYPWCYVTEQILDNGPLRVTCALQYEKKKINGDSIREVRTITLDKYSQLNRMSVSYEGLSRAAVMAAGIVVHAADTVDYTLQGHEGWMSYIDPTDNAKGQSGKIFVGCVFPEKTKGMELRRFSKTESQKERGGDYGHLLATREINKQKTTAAYYWGAAWNRYNFNNIQEWNNYLRQFASSLRHPLQISVR